MLLTGHRVAPGEEVSMDILSTLSAARLLPVVVVDDASAADALAGALVEGGLPVAEVTFRTAAARDSIRAMADRGDVLVGAGTVVTVAQVDQAVAAGARFVVSPGLSRVVVERCQELGVLVVPGVVTATEIQAALELGLTTVKFFPAGTSGGAAAIAALAAPFAGVRFVPTGGVGPTNLHEYLALPSVVAVGGSWMVARDRIAAGDFAGITQLTAAAVALAAPPGPSGSGRATVSTPWRAGSGARSASAGRSSQPSRTTRSVASSRT